MEINREKLSELLLTALGNESQVVFAQRCGLSKEHLSRMLSGKTNSRPSKTTLRKIAEHSKVEYNSLLAACGYTNETIQRKPVEVRAKENTAAMLEGFLAMTKTARLYPSTKTFMEELFLLYGHEKLTVKMSSPEEYEGPDHPHAEYFQKGKIEFYALGRLCTTWFVLYFCQTKGGQIVVVDAAMDGKTLLENNMIDPQAEDILYEGGVDIYQLPYYFELKKDYRAEVNFLQALFSDPVESLEKNIVTSIGYGFTISEVPKNFAAFLEKHQETAKINGVLSNNTESAAGMIFNVVSLGADPVEELKDCVCYYTDDCGYAAAIANIMKEETGITFALWKGLDNDPLTVMVEDKNLDMDEVLPIIRDYAKELGIQKYGECIAYMEYTRDPKMQFEITD